MRTSELLGSLPDDIARRFRAGSVGAPALADLSRLCVGWAASESEPRGLLALGLDLALAAFEADPYAPQVADFLLAAHGRAPFLSERWLRRLSKLRVPAFHGENARQALSLAEAGEAEAGFAFLEGLPANTRMDPYLWGAAIRLARIKGEWGRAGEFFKGVRGGPRGFLSIARGECRFQTGEVAEALDAYEAAKRPDSAWLLNRMAECRLRLGDRDGAARDFASSLAARPWQATVLLRLHSMLTGQGEAFAPLPGRVVVMLYTWNKAELLDATLAALAPSLGDCVRLVALDNGSSDATPDVLSAWSDRLGDLMAARVRLPVNVGAPAARNWLLSLPEVAASDYAAFLDDDAVLPTDWAERLGAAALAYPDAGAYGCKVVSVGDPSRIQHADIQLLPPRTESEHDLAPGTASFAVHAPQSSVSDAGQFGYIRPAASVTGCFHLFRTSVLLDGPGFDLRFSPSQLDDLDHDLALLERGRHAVYQGFLTVRHACSTGLSRDGEGRLAGNVHKLYRKWPSARMAPLLEASARALMADIEAKEAELTGMGVLPGER